MSRGTYDVVTRSTLPGEEGDVRANVSPFRLGRLLDPEVSVNTSENVQRLTLVPVRERYQGGRMKLA